MSELVAGAILTSLHGFQMCSIHFTQDESANPLVHNRGRLQHRHLEPSYPKRLGHGRHGHAGYQPQNQLTASRLLIEHYYIIINSPSLIT